MIADKIKKDVKDEFSSLKDALQIHLNPDFNVSQTKQFLQTHIPKEIVYKSEILLDTLLNYLMEDARSKIKTANVEFQNAFFDVDFRKRVHEWANQLENKLELEPDIVDYTSDPRLKQGLIASGITFVVGAGITSTLFFSMVGAVISGMVTILLSAIAFKIAYEKASPKAREIVKNDIDQYLKTSQMQVAEWLEKTATAFDNDLTAFCSANGFELNG